MRFTSWATSSHGALARSSALLACALRDARARAAFERARAWGKALHLDSHGSRKRPAPIFRTAKTTPIAFPLFRKVLATNHLAFSRRLAQNLRPIAPH